MFSLSVAGALPCATVQVAPSSLEYIIDAHIVLTLSTILTNCNGNTNVPSYISIPCPTPPCIATISVGIFLIMLGLFLISVVVHDFPSSSDTDILNVQSGSGTAVYVVQLYSFDFHAALTQNTLPLLDDNTVASILLDLPENGLPLLSVGNLHTSIGSPQVSPLSSERLQNIEILPQLSFA